MNCDASQGRKSTIYCYCKHFCKLYLYYKSYERVRKGILKHLDFGQLFYVTFP